MTRRLLALSLLLLSCAPKNASKRASKRTSKNGPRHAHEERLANGLSMFVVENAELPVVTLVLRWRNGAITDPPDAPGLTLLAHAARVDLSEDVPVSFVWGADFTELRMRLLADELDVGLRQLARLSVAPEMRPRAVEGAKRDVAGELARTSDEPDRVARRHLDRLLLGERHPAGRAPAAEAILAIPSGRIAPHYDRSFGPERAALGIAGDVRAADVAARVRRAFGAWERGSADGAPPPPRRARGVRLVDRPELTQATIAIATLREGADRAALELAAEVVGGPAAISSRLMRRARTREGRTYDVRIQVEEEPWGTRILTLTSSRVEEAPQTLDLVRGELARAASPAGAISIEELAAARARRLGALALALETPEQRLDALLRAWALGLPSSAVDAHRARLASATPAEVSAAARLLDPADAAIVVVGPASRLRAPLEERFGGVEIVAPE